MKRKFIIISIVIIAALGIVGGGLALNGYFGGGAGSEAFDAGTLTRGLVGYWNCDEGSGTIATDATDHNTDGTLTNGPAWPTGKAGNAAALDFDGSDDYVATPYTSSIGTSHRTFSVWFKTSFTGGTSVIIAKRPGDADQLTMFICGDDNCNGGGNRIVLLGGNSPPAPGPCLPCACRPEYR